MKKRILIFILLCLTLSGHGQWRQTHCLLEMVRDFLVSGSDLYVTTNKGLFLSPDSGKTWKAVNGNLFAEKISVSGTSIITARNQTLWRSKDNGLTWENISANFHPHGTNSVIRTIFFHDQRLFIGLGGADAMYHSDDLGDSWVEANNGFPYFDWGYHSIFCSVQDESYMYVGTSGGVYRSLNWNGDCWQEYSGGLPRNMEVYPDPVQSMIAFNGKLYAGTTRGKGVYTSDNHSEWWIYNGLDGNYVYDLATDSTTIYAVCNSNGLFSSGNGGTTWDFHGMTDAQPYQVKALGSRTFLNTYHSGFLISGDQGFTWDPPNTLTDAYVTAVSGYDGKILAGTAGTEIFFSGDQGTTWGKSTLNYYPGPSGENRIRQFLVCRDTLYAATGNSGVIRSVDGGITWDDASSGLPSGSSGHLPVWVLTARADTIYAGTDGGLYWARLHSDWWQETGFTGKVFSFIIHNKTWYAGSDNGVYTSSDEGTNWDHQGLFQDSVLCLAVSQGQLMAGTNKGIYRKELSSGDWIPAGGGIVASDVRNMIPYFSNLFVTVDPGSILMTRDNGNTWTDVAEGVFDTVTNLAIQGNFILASTFGEGVWMRNLEEIAGVEEAVQTEFFTIQPNPVRDHLIIRITAAEPGDVTVDLLNLTGKTCLPEKKFPVFRGINQTEINCSPLPLGMYLLQVTLGNRIETKKLIIWQPAF